MNKAERNHRLQILKELLNGIMKSIILIILVYTKLNKKIGSIIPMWLIVIGCVMIIISYYILKWYKTMYYFKENSIFYQQGIMNITKREVPLDKITTIDISQGIFERVFKLSKIKIDTENVKSDKSEITLLLTKKRALNIREKLLGNKNESTKIDKKSTKNQYNLSFKNLILYSLVSNSIFQGLIIVWALYNYLDDIEKVMHFNSLEYIRQIQLGSTYLIIAIIIVVLIIGLGLSLMKNCLKYSFYNVYVEDNKLHISHGLINKKNYSFDKNKIKGIHIKQKSLMQLMQTSTIEIESIGYGDEQGERAVLYPFCNNELRSKILNDLLPEFKFEDKINKAPHNTYVRFLLKKIIFTGIIVGIISYAIKYGFVSLLLMVLAFILGHMQYKNSAIGMSDKLAYMSYGGFCKKQTIVKNEAIQSIKISYSFFQKKKGVCNYTVNIWGKVLGKNITIKNLCNHFYKSYIHKL